MTSYLILCVAFAAIFYGLSPLAGTTPDTGMSGRGSLACVIGFALIALVSAVKLLS